MSEALHFLSLNICTLFLLQRTVGIRQDDVGTLPSQLQSDLLQVTAAGRLLDQVTHLRRRHRDTEVEAAGHIRKSATAAFVCFFFFAVNHTLYFTGDMCGRFKHRPGPGPGPGCGL